MASDHRIIFGDALEVLRRLDAESVDCCVTSPPYFNLRDYHVPGQIGLEATIDEYVARLVEVFAEVRRVLKPHGTVALNLGDSYARDATKGWKGPYGKHDYIPDCGSARRILSERRGSSDGFVGRGDRAARRVGGDGLKPKDLIGIPWRVAFALQADGWWLRNDVIWVKPNAMPESVTDRFSSKHEHVFLLAKRALYWFDLNAVREPLAGATLEDIARRKNPGRHDGMTRFGKAEGLGAGPRFHGLGKNPGDVVTLATQPTPYAHFATFPLDLVLRFLPALCPPRICATCGKPWQHLVERISKGRSYATGKSKAKRDAGLATAFSGYDDGSPSPTARDLGYFPDCPHYGYGGDNLAHRVQVLLKAKGGENVAAELAECIALRDAIPEDSWLPGTVLDPFLGSGTTTQAARKLGRRSIGIELNGGYERVIRERLACPEGALIQDVEFEHEEART